MHLYFVVVEIERSQTETFFKGFGAGYGTAKAGVGVASMGVMHPELVMKSIVPCIMAGVLGIYGLIIAAILGGNGMYLFFRLLF